MACFRPCVMLALPFNTECIKDLGSIVPVSSTVSITSVGLQSVELCTLVVDRLHRSEVEGPEVCIKRVEGASVVIFVHGGAHDTLGKVLRSDIK